MVQKWWRQGEEEGKWKKEANLAEKMVGKKNGRKRMIGAREGKKAGKGYERCWTMKKTRIGESGMELRNQSKKNDKPQFSQKRGRDKPQKNLINNQLIR